MRTVLATSLAALLVLLAGSAAQPQAAPRERALLVVGDSLSVGVAPFLHRQLPGYAMRASHRVGLLSPQVARRVVRARDPLPHVLVVSAGTNDNPQEVGIFSHSVETVLGQAGRSRCVVWANVARPPVAGTSYEQLNDALARMARQSRALVLVDWARLVERNPRLLRADRVHATDAGYRARAAAIARAVTTRCSS